jgi:FkbM family methyltransferase
MHPLLEILKEHKINDLLIVDVGAKESIDFISGLEHITNVHAFEPNPAEYTLLQRKYAAHPFKELHLKSLGLADMKGKSSFHVSNKSSMSSLLKPDLINYKKHFGKYKAYDNWSFNIETAKKIEIELETLDHYFGKITPIDYLKIDTQGSELAVLKGSQKLLEHGAIKVIKLEVSTVATYEQQAFFSDIDIYLRKYQYGLVDFVTYKETPSYLLGENLNIHSAPCGDAIYYYTPDYVSETDNLKKAIIINYLGYASLATNIVSKTSLTQLKQDELIKKSKAILKQKWKLVIKDLVPPLLLKIIKKLVH